MKLEFGDKVRVLLSAADSGLKHIVSKEGYVRETSGRFVVVQIGKQTYFMHPTDLEVLK